MQFGRGPDLSLVQSLSEAPTQVFEDAVGMASQELQTLTDPLNLRMCRALSGLATKLCATICAWSKVSAESPLSNPPLAS
jgi:hypothetical protein